MTRPEFSDSRSRHLRCRPPNNPGVGGRLRRLANGPCCPYVAFFVPGKSVSLEAESLQLPPKRSRHWKQKIFSNRPTTSADTALTGVVLAHSFLTGAGVSRARTRGTRAKQAPPAVAVPLVLNHLLVAAGCWLLAVGGFNLVAAGCPFPLLHL